MKFTTSLLASALAYFAVSVIAAPAGRSALDVWNPTITSPTAETVWIVGSTVNVTWSTANEPADVSNGGQVVLADLSPIFNLAAADGFYTVTVPDDIAPGNDYQVVLFGDSGNISPSFTIVAT
ncbi:hypothetical protein BT96DRAFT_838379 [Gymnopus androsaceus JB14]|uniref:Yeast cell wall synthesis Kre9/Knh1-like N-terminal domain-containing protein n=1 Tax=Gymnopus androsaceus JB14 TaxID=1447944 RepID=A0A6A4GMJ3_9AGAR|nr:hypothetical protein BT96DRAFT_838379 [Gymnopus androsaceus JB14]